MVKFNPQSFLFKTLERVVRALVANAPYTRTVYGLPN